MWAETGTVCCDITLDHQRRHRDRESPANGRHAVAVIDLDIVEENLVDMAVAARKFDRANLDAGCTHIHPEISQTLMLLRGRIGANDNDAIVRILGITRPEFLAVQLPAIAILFRFHPQARKVGAASWFREKLAPDFFALKRFQNTLFDPCLVFTKFHDDRHRHAERNAKEMRRHTESHFFGFKGDFFDMCQALATHFRWPIDSGKACVEARFEIAATKLKLFVVAQLRLCSFAIGRRYRFKPPASACAKLFEIAHAASPSASMQSTSTSSQNSMLPCSIARLRERRIWRCNPASHVTPMPPCTCTQSRAHVS